MLPTPTRSRPAAFNGEATSATSAPRPRPPLLLLGAYHSYFTAKVRSYLRWRGREGELFEEAAATAEAYRHVIQPRTGVAFIPVLLVRDPSTGEVLASVQDSSVIVDEVERMVPLEALRRPVAPGIETHPRRRFAAFLIEYWADEFLKLPAMHYRWSFLDVNRAYLLHQWGRTSAPHVASSDERDALVLSSGGKGATFTAMSKTLPILGITPNTIPEIERQFLALLDVLEAHFRAHMFLLGGRAPTLADFALMGPLYAHLALDPYPCGIVRGRAPALASWIDRMNGLRPADDALPGAWVVDAATKSVRNPDPSLCAEFGRVPSFVGGHANANADADADEKDDVPPTIIPLLRMVFEEFVPNALDVHRCVAAYFAENNVGFGDPIPRVVGMHTLRLGGGKATEQRAVFPYEVWMLQRVLDNTNAPVVGAWLREMGMPPSAAELVSLAERGLPDSRVRLVGNKLFRDPQRVGVASQARL